MRQDKLTRHELGLREKLWKQGLQSLVKLFSTYLITNSICLYQDLIGLNRFPAHHFCFHIVGKFYIELVQNCLGHLRIQLFCINQKTVHIEDDMCDRAIAHSEIEEFMELISYVLLS